ncbi:MAG: type I 3-dehydroquinate dehydratase [Phycisphaerae bacterium]|nr:type I 3-dehydroquinate dehydratase [Phycisphaerae bacterium]
MTRLCVAIRPKTTAEAIDQMKRLGRQADLLELRVDAMDECDLGRVLAARAAPLIVTNRAANEGGFRPQDEARRLEVLVEAVRLGADYVDVELAALTRFQQLADAVPRERTRLIVSCHNFQRMPDDLVATARRIDATAAADVVKVVGTARMPEDNLPCFEALRSVRKPAVALAMGEAGQPSRILAGKFGAWLTYASEAAGAESAPGQITLEQMRSLYRADRVGPATAVYAVMGNPVGHSLSPAIHNAAFKELGIDAVYVRLKVEGDPAAAVRALSAVPIDGYSVTIPHKQAVMAACVEVDPTARRIGAVNTLIRRDDGYHATNTDVTSAMRVLAGAMGSDDFTGKRALVVGGGGVGRAYVYGLIGRGATVHVSDIDAARREQLASEAGATAVAPDHLGNVRADILMNGSPVGMWPKVDDTPVDASLLRPGMVVFDAVYNPRETRLLREARAAGGVTISGVEQFVGQAVEQFELWTQQRAPFQLMRQVVLDALQSH